MNKLINKIIYKISFSYIYVYVYIYILYVYIYIEYGISNVSDEFHT
jgi:hypothetical protein